MYQYLSVNLDAFMRFAFLQFFILFLSMQFATLLPENWWIEIIGYVEFSVAWVIYVFIHLKLRMEMLPDKERSMFNAINFYLLLRCCFPKKKKLVVKKKKKTA